MSENQDQVRHLQREALWKWRWLGFRNSTPAFKASLILSAVGAVYIVAHALMW